MYPCANPQELKGFLLFSLKKILKYFYKFLIFLKSITTSVIEPETTETNLHCLSFSDCKCIPLNTNFLKRLNYLDKI